MKRAPFSLFFAILLSIFVLVQPRRTSSATQSNELTAAQEQKSEMAANSSPMQQGEHFARHGARASKATARQREASPMAGSLFANAVAYDSGGLGAGSVAVADVNGDGKPDLVVANACGNSSNCPNGGTVGVLLGNGDGTFQAAVAYGTGGSGATSVAVADVNGDGKPDLLVANGCASSSNCNTGTVGVLLGNGDGTFQKAVAYGSGGYDATSVAVADVNGDGKPDLVVTDYCSSGNNQTGCASGSASVVGVLLGNGDGTFRAVVTYGLGSNVTMPSSVAIADVNGDGKPDLLVASYEEDAIGMCDPSSCSGTVSVLLGNGDGTFQAAVVYGSGQQWATSVAVGDVNGDGKPDLVVANYCEAFGYCGFDGYVGVLLGNGNGTFQNAVTYDAGAYATLSVALGDVNGDGKPDVLAASSMSTSNFGSSPGTVGVFLGNGDGTLEPAVQYGSGGYNATSIAVADVNGDGRPDVVVANGCNNGSNQGCPSGSSGVVGVLLNTSISFGLVANPDTVTISAPGQSGSTTITINANGNLNAQSLTNWGCSGLPAGAGCTFGTVGSNDQISLSISTTAASDLHRPTFGHRQQLFYALLLPGLLGLVSTARRRRTLTSVRLLILIAVLGIPALWLACGGSGGGHSGGGGGGGGGTPTGSSVVTVSASNGTLKPSTTIKLVVQ